MSDEFSIECEWLSADLDDPAEASTTAEVSVAVDDEQLTRIFDPRTGEISEGTRLPTIGLAEGLVRGWWQLLYEPQRTADRQPRQNFEHRHRLDRFTAGYVFPPIGIWSGGETAMVGLFKADTRFQIQEFRLPTNFKPRPVARGMLEAGLTAFVDSTLNRLQGSNWRGADLREDWDRLRDLVNSPDELEWCRNAGRLGLDPYDPDTIDLGNMSAGISEALFADICEAVDLSDLHRACEWTRQATARLRHGPPISLKDFGGPPYRDLTFPGWRNGIDAVELLRQRLKLPMDPRQALRRLFDDPETGEADRVPEMASGAVEGVARRENSEIRATVPARSIKQKRFRTCRATYLGWRASSNTEIAITPAETWRQQASRAFAAELLAPAKLIKDRYGKTGLNRNSVERLSSEWLCPEQIIVHQAKNNEIVVKGVEHVAVF
jgi:hypothetical protein